MSSRAGSSNPEREAACAEASYSCDGRRPSVVPFVCSKSNLLERVCRAAHRRVEPVRSTIARGDRLVEELLTSRPDADLCLLESAPVGRVDRPVEAQRLGNLVRDFHGQREKAGYEVK